MSDIVIRVENLYKEYRLGTISHGTLHQDIQSWWARMRGKEDPNSIISTVQPSTLNSSENPHMLALNDVSFEVKRGEVLGIIGRNGAGKSTLLKILSEVTAPTKGTVKIKGRVASLLEVGTGFHPELTGRENVYVNGAILGMTKKEIAGKFDEIVAFAEIENFIDTPVKRYSSGMYVRLAFAVAAHLEPEILIVDEVLAVGDAQFQKKCLGKMDDVAKGGRTVLFVSHNMAMILFLCPRSLLLNNGTILMNEETAQVIETYVSGCGSSTQSIVDLAHALRSAGNEKAIKSVWAENVKGDSVSEVLMGSEMKICFSFSLQQQQSNLAFGFGIENMFGQRIFSMNNILSDNSQIATAKEGKAVFDIKELPLLPGRYLISLSIVQNQTTWIDYVERAFQLTVLPADVFGTGRMLDRSQGMIYVKGRVYLEA